MNILISWLGPLRAICMAIDGVAFSLLDNAYELVIKLSTAELFQHETIRSLTSNIYILIGVVAFFRLALVLVNAIIDPEKLNEKGKGLASIFFRVVGMIILLAVTPFLFQMSYELQGKIVGADTGENIIFKTILGDNANIGGDNAGKALQNIVLSSLITVNENYYDSFSPIECISNGDGTCTNQGGYIYGGECTWDNCKKAVSLYNDLYVNEEMSPNKLSKYVGVSKKIDGDEVYVYNYMLIITTVVGIAMTYIIISFAIDIAVRMFELLVLEVLSPLFIATFVDPKSAQSGPFKNWLSAVGRSYVSLYIKLAILALMVLLISFINQSKIFQSMGDLSGWAKIITVIGLLIFAKKAPKWIGDMIGIKGDGGLGGLSIGKKLGGMALAGGLAAKGLESAKKFTGQKGKNFLANRARNTAARIGGMKEAHAENKQNKKNGILTPENKKSLWQQGRAAAKNSRQENWGKDAQGLFKDIGQGYMSGRLNLNPSAESLNEHFKTRAATDSMNYNTRIGNSQEEINKRKDAAKKMKTAIQMRRGKPQLNNKGERDTKKSWQGYNEFKAAIGSSVLTESEAYLKDIENNGLYNASTGEYTIDGKIYHNEQAAIEAYKNTFTSTGQKDITAFVTKNFQAQTESLKSNIDIRVDNDQKITGYRAQIAELKNSGVSADDAAIKSLEGQIEQLVAQNEKINESTEKVIDKLINSEKTFLKAPHKCPTAVQDGDDFVTAVGKFSKQVDGSFIYEENDKVREAEVYTLDPTTINDVISKAASVASSKDGEAKEAHSAMEPKN